MKQNFDNITIKGILSVIPSNYSKFEDELSNYSFTKDQSEKLGKTFGYNQHNVVRCEDTSVSDLAIFGLKKLIENKLIIKKNVEAVILVTQSPDYFIPPTTSIINESIEFQENTEFYDINQGCNGFILGLKQAALLLSAGTKEVLLICGDVLSKKVSIQDRNSYPLSGDACSIILLQQEKGGGVLNIDIRNDGSGAMAINIRDGGFKYPYNESSNIMHFDEFNNYRCNADLVMQGDKVFNFVMQKIPDFLQNFCKEQDCVLEDIDWIFSHQPNKFMLDRLIKKLRIKPEKLPSDTVSKYGNSSSATIPVTINEHFKNDKTKKKVLFLGFGVGLSWGAALTTLGNLNFNEIIYYDE